MLEDTEWALRRYIDRRD